MLGPNSNIEQRMRELEVRFQRAMTKAEFDDLQVDAHQDLSQRLHRNFKEPGFKSMALLMQQQMYMQALSGPDDDKSSMTNNFIDPMMLQQMQFLQQMQGKPAMGSPMGMQMPGLGNNSSYSNPLMNMVMMNMMQTQAVNPAVSSAMFGPKVAPATMPVSGRISSHYGERKDPVHGHTHFHHGVDIAAAQGTPIKAPWAGEVVYVGYVEGFGDNTVVMSHPETQQEDGRIVYSIFGHNSSVNVQVGDQVAKGESFAAVGSEGKSTGPHLHWETRLAEPGLAGAEIFNKKDHLSMSVNPLRLA